MSTNAEKTLCVIGASGLVGANITREALARGYRVNGTLRNVSDPDKAPYLMALPGAAKSLTLFEGDMATPVAFAEALIGADCVFIASLIPTYFGTDGTPARELDDQRGYEEIVRPTLDGCLNILREASAAGIKKAVICSSTSSTNPVPAVLNKNEVDHWSDEGVQYREKKYTSAAKTVMENAAMAFAEQQGMRLSILLPTLMLGPAVLPSHANEGFMKVLVKMARGEAGRHDQVPDSSSSMIHLEDLSALFLAAYENGKASGRYFAVYDSWHWQDIYAELAKLLPDTPMPAPLESLPSEATSFDFTRRDSLGVPIRPIPEILRDTISWCKQQQPDL